MTISIILAIAALSVPIIMRLAKGNASEPGTEPLRSVDLEAFRNLVDPEEENYLRENLSPAEFRKIQRERMLAAIDYVKCAASNAGILVHFAQRARQSADPETAAAAGKLIDDALRLRTYAIKAIPLLYLGVLLPGRRISPARVAESYELMTRQVVLLGLQYPTGEISSAL